jgi:hypothetical protein
MTDTVTSQNIVLSSWDTLYIYSLVRQISPLNMKVHFVPRSKHTPSLYKNLSVVNCVSKQYGSCLLW